MNSCCGKLDGTIYCYMEGLLRRGQD
uniref:Uncharacterized protein n=1 Tax=Rhizophora mucronata TaxID=61149 RepID=A0A2P2QTI8_RHIMU